MDIEQLRKEFEDAGLAHVANTLISFARPAVGIRRVKRSEKRIRRGQSKLGGCPDLPPNFAWLHWEGNPQVFVAQINLVEAAPHRPDQMLPAAGLLYFFCDFVEMPWGMDPTNRGSWALIYYEGPISTLKRTPLPPNAEGVVLFDAWLTACSVTFFRDLTPLSWFSTQLDGVLRWQDQDRYWDWWINYFQQRRPIHQLLGQPWLVQGNEQRERQLAAHGVHLGDTKPFRNPRFDYPGVSEEDWRLLLQLDYDDTVRMWLGGGIAYCWIRERDLRERNFADTWLLWQYA